MSKSPLKDFSRLLDTHAKTVKKEENRKEEPAYPVQLLRYDVLTILFRPPTSSMISKPNLMRLSGIIPDFLTKTQP